jgi:hypothetical protein
MVLIIRMYIFSAEKNEPKIYPWLNLIFLCFRKDSLQSHIRRVHPELSQSHLSSGKPVTGNSDFAESEFDDRDLEEEEEDAAVETPARELEEMEAKFFCQTSAGQSGELSTTFGKKLVLNAHKMRSLLKKTISCQSYDREWGAAVAQR